MRAHERIIQFPFTAAIEVEKTEEELARAAEKRRAQGKKLNSKNQAAAEVLGRFDTVIVNETGAEEVGIDSTFLLHLAYSMLTIF